MRRSTKVIIALTILAGILLVTFTCLIFPPATEDELKTATVTLLSYRKESVGFKPRRRGSTNINAMIYTASDGEEYQIALFYTDEAKELSGRTVTVRYLEDGGDYVGAHMIVELTEGEQGYYTLDEWNKTQRGRVWGVLILWGLWALLAFLYVLSDVCGIFSHANRYRRSAKKKNAHEKQLANLQNRPRNFPNTVWQTEDGTLTLTVAPDGAVTGTIRMHDGGTVKSIPIRFDDTAHTTVRIAELRAGKKRGSYTEIWEADYESPTEFTAKPRKTTYFRKDLDRPPYGRREVMIGKCSNWGLARRS